MHACMLTFTTVPTCSQSAYFSLRLYIDACRLMATVLPLLLPSMAASLEECFRFLELSSRSAVLAVVQRETPGGRMMPASCRSLSEGQLSFG